MHTPKRIRQKLIQLIQRAMWLPNSVLETIRRRRQQAVLNKLEIERLDRIRNPSKYLGA